MIIGIDNANSRKRKEEGKRKVFRYTYSDRLFFHSLHGRNRVGGSCIEFSLLSPGLFFISNSSRIVAALVHSDDNHTTRQGLPSFLERFDTMGLSFFSLVDCCSFSSSVRELGGWWW